MCNLIVKSYRMNLFQNIFMIIQLVILLILFNSVVSGLIYDGKISNYIDDYKETTVFLSGAVENNVPASDSEQFLYLVENLKTINGVKDVGYTIEESSFVNDNENAIIKTIYLNKYMSTIEYPLSSGKWFSKESADMQIIIGGELNHKYDIGDHINLSRIYYGDGMQTKDFDAVIVGKLKNPALVMDLNYSSNRPILQNLFESEPNIILTNNDCIIDQSNLYFPLGSLILETEKDITAASIKELEQYGQYHSLDSIQANSILIMNETIKQSLPPLIILFISILFGFIGFTYLYTYKFMKNLSVLYICGANIGLLNRLVISQSAISCLISTVVFVFVQAIPIFKEIFFRRALWGAWNCIITVGVVVLVFIITLICSKIMLRKTPVEILRRYE